MAKMRSLLPMMTLILIVLLGCKAERPEPTMLFESPESPIRPASTAQPPAPSPTSPPPSPTPESALPEPSSAEVGVVGGTLHTTAEPSTPLSGLSLYLARVIQSEHGIPLAASLDEHRAPKSPIKEDGSFIFRDVPPGTYGLVIKTPIVSVMLEDANGDDLLITLEAGQVIDLAEIYTDLTFR